MSEPLPAGSALVPLDVEWAIDRVCDRFEAEWRAGRRPAPEDYLGQTPEPGRSELLGELLRLELDYRRRLGEAPSPEEYAGRFPGHGPVLDSVFRPPTPAGVEGLLGVADPPAATTPDGAGAAATLPPSSGAGGPAVPGYEVLGE